MSTIDDRFSRVSVSRFHVRHPEFMNTSSACEKKIKEVLFEQYLCYIFMEICADGGASHMFGG